MPARKHPKAARREGTPNEAAKWIFFNKAMLGDWTNGVNAQGRWPGDL